LLAIVLITDEDDCSAPDDSDLFDSQPDPGDRSAGADGFVSLQRVSDTCVTACRRPGTVAAANLMNCHSNENGRLMRIADFVTFFKSLKAAPDDVIVAAITGPATPYSVAMHTVRDRARGVTEEEPQIVPSCMSTKRQRRARGTHQGLHRRFGVNGTLESICEGDFSPAMARIGDKKSRGASAPVPASAARRSRSRREGVQANCEVFEETTTSDGVIRSSIRSCDDVAPRAGASRPTAPAPAPAPR